MGAFPARRRKRTRGAFAAACGLAAVAVTAAACSSGSSGTGNQPGTTGGTPVSGGTAVYALPPSTTPNYIFPFTSSSYFSVVNAEDFQYLMYRPLYWFGNGASPTLNTSLSLADAPVYNGKDVTITLKGWKWSNGETGERPGRPVLDPHAAGGRLQRLGRLRARRVPDQRVQRQGNQRHDGDHDDEQGVQPDLVHLQRAQPDHPHAAGLGQDRVRAE